MGDTNGTSCCGLVSYLSCPIIIIIIIIAVVAVVAECISIISKVKIPWEVEVHTSDVKNAGTNANVFMVLYGDKGKTDEIELRNKTDNFERNQVS